MAVGGGIFSTLGVVVGISGPWAWASFTIAGLIALVAGCSHVKLAAYYGEGGGAFAFFHFCGAADAIDVDRRFFPRRPFRRPRPAAAAGW